MSGIINRAFKSQIVSFAGLEYAGGIRPTDIDMLLDFGGRFFVVAETKFMGDRGPESGQFRSLRCLGNTSREAFLAIYCRHTTPVGHDIKLAHCEVYGGRFKTWDDYSTRPMEQHEYEGHTVRSLIDAKLHELGLADRYIMNPLKAAA